MEKYEKLVKKIREKKSIAVAFSGGADSSLVAKACIDAGIKCIAITILSPLIPEREKRNAVKVAKEIGIRHVFIEKKLSNIVKKNDRRRCYYCKKEDAILLKKYANRNGFNFVADGINAHDNYIGTIASNEEGIWHPLLELNINKKDIRNILKKLNISIWDKPSESCMATRIGYGEKLTLKKLKKIEKAEDFLLNYSKKVRVRIHKKIARIEVLDEDIENLFIHRKEILKKLKEYGFKYITIDLEGYRKGSMEI